MSDPNRADARPTLVTGATGFVGAAVARRLLAAGHRVRVLARPGGDRRNLAGLAVEVAEGDLRDRASLERAVSGCGALFHVAADYRIWVPDPAAMHRTNVDGSRALFEAAAAAGVARMVYTSSVATLGLHRDGTPADEATPVTLGDMIGTYKRSKFLAEAEVSRLVRERGMPIVIVNPSTPVGPRDVKPTPTGKMIVEAAAGRMPAYVDTGLNIVHVDDVAEGHLLAFERGAAGERYVLGGTDMALAEILAAIARITGGKAPKVRLPHDVLWPVAIVAELAGRVTGKEPFLTFDGLRMSKKRMYFSSAKARRVLGYAPRPAERALEDAVAWFRAHGYLDRA
ncbi:MAG: NAD-dependent epimerase/dehydratase family protein [Alphaproteobacteria bacterium]|nr:NAD-dependent epimerase/dehydratase family protein [Alphaproteobacteria bacterium]